MQYINFSLDPKNDYLQETVAYLNFCAFAITAAMVIGVVLGALVSRNAILAFIAVNVSGLMRAVPTIAILLLFVPTLGLGFLPTIIVLVVLAIPPILLNTYTGVRGIEPPARDAAKAMRMTSLQTAP